MTRLYGALGLGCLLVVASAGGCSDSPKHQPGPQGEPQTGDGLGAQPGTLGGECATDDECPSGLQCISVWGFPSTTKYCAPRCSTEQDCQAFAETSYVIEVPADSSVAPNHWGLTLLQRGYVCDHSNEHGEPQKFCQFVCPDLSAAKANGDCTCLPRHKWVKDEAGDPIRCEWDEDVECSIVVYPGRSNRCDACNSEPLLEGCYTGDYRCGMNPGFNGQCYHWVDGTSIDSCLASSSFDCDPDCAAQCYSVEDYVSDTCLDLCCKESRRPPSVAPECMPETDPSDPGGQAGAGAGGGGPGGAGAAPGNGGTGGEEGMELGGTGNGDPGQPDLTNVTFNLHVTGRNPNPGGEGAPMVPWIVEICIEPAEENSVTVDNAGTGATQPYTMGISLIGLNDAVVGTCKSLSDSQPLPPGFVASWENQICCTFSDQRSLYDLNPRRIRVTADIDGTNVELDETNNDSTSVEFDLDDLPNNYSN